MPSDTSLKLGGTLPWALNYFWKQHDLCPSDDLGGWSLPTILPITVTLGHGLSAELLSPCRRPLRTWVLAFLLPCRLYDTLQTRWTLPLPPAWRGAWPLGTPFHAGTAAVPESCVCFRLVEVLSGVPLLFKRSPLRLVLNNPSALLLRPHSDPQATSCASRLSRTLGPAS